jgi:RHS repeat-associated protein
MINKKGMRENTGQSRARNRNDATSIWKLNSVNEFGQPTGVTTGNVTRTYGYDAYGLPTARTAGSFQNFSYAFDPLKGNLTYRKDNKSNMQENFTYDNLNRLTGYAGQSTTYDIKGNITKKSDVGNFAYNNAAKPYAISNATLSQISVPLRSQSVTYTSFKRPSYVYENGYAANFTYNGNEERVKMDVKKNGVKELTRYYLSGCYEIDDRAISVLKEKLYLGGDYYSAPAVYVKEGSGNWQLYYICRDYLGSITHVTTPSGYVRQELSYDAWGRLRDPSNQAVYTPGEEPTLFLGRGYTGHEHLPWFGLVNMNARLYDPALGRFLAPDPYVQMPGFSQSYNRYSYVLNNPLLYTDLSGEIFGIDDLLFAVIVGVVVGAYIGGSAAEGTLNPFEWNWDKNTWAGIGIGAGVGALGGWGFSVAVPALAGTPFFSHFGASGTIAAYSLTGTLAGGAVGYGAGFGTALYMSNGDWDYANKMGQRMSGLGSQIGSVAGIFAGGWEVYENYLQNRRPDADRHLTLAEANDWYRNGNGEPLDVDLENFDLSRISPQDFNRTNRQNTFNLLFPNNISSVNDGLVYGSISLTLHDGNYVTASKGFDMYDFEMHPWRTSPIRNVETIIGHIYAGWWGTPYRINIHGRKYLDNKKSR